MNTYLRHVCHFCVCFQHLTHCSTDEVKLTKSSFLYELLDPILALSQLIPRLFSTVIFPLLNIKRSTILMKSLLGGLNRQGIAITVIVWWLLAMLGLSKSILMCCLRQLFER